MYVIVVQLMNTKCLWLSGYYDSLHKGVIYVPVWLCEVVSDHSLGIIKATVTPLSVFICLHSAK